MVFARPFLVIVEPALEELHASVGDEHPLVRRRGEQVAIVRDDDEAAFEIDQCLRERLAHLDVEMVRGLVEEQQVGTLPHDEGEGETRLLAARKARYLLRHLVAAEIEAAEIVAEELLALARREAFEVPERRLVEA